MADIAILIVLLLYRLTVVHAASIPGAIEIFRVRNGLSNTLNSSNPSNLSAPTPPLGFKADLEFNESIPLNPVEVYVNAIEFIALLSIVGWTSSLESWFTLSQPQFKSVCSIGPLPNSGRLELQVKYAALGLYQAGVAISQNRFYKLRANLLLENALIGYVEFAPKQGKSVQGTVLTNYTYSVESTISNTTLMADSGIVVDPEESAFHINYQFDGVKIKAQDLFTSFLDAFTISAQYDNEVVGAEISAARSLSGEVILSTWEVGSSSEMTWARLKRAILIIWQRLVIGSQGTSRPRFEGMTFGLEYAGQKIGAGRILRFSAASNGTAETTVSK